MILEGVKDINPECPICKNTNIEFKSKKKGGRSGRRIRKRKRKNTSQSEEAIEESEDDMSNHPLMDKSRPIKPFSQFEKDFNGKNDDMYKQKLTAFDEDFAASQLDLMIG